MTRSKQTLQRHEGYFCCWNLSSSLFSELSSMGCLLEILASISLCHFVYSPFPQGPIVTGALPAAVQGHVN